MKTDNLIQFNPSKQLLQKAWNIVNDVEFFLSNANSSVDCLIDALSWADVSLKLKIVPLLGLSGQERVLEPLYGLVVNSRQDERVRQMAAVQLSIAVSRCCNDPSDLRKRLITGLSHQDGAIRENCALALGWEGNIEAVKDLVQCLNDPDRGVQSAAVSALSSVDDDRVFDLLINRLSVGIFEEKRNILLHLWRFARKRSQVASVYIDHLEDLDNDLRMDALFGMAMIPPSSKILDAYRKIVTNEKGAILRRVLENLSGMDPFVTKSFEDVLRNLASDPDARIRQLAIRIVSSPVSGKWS